MTPKSLFRMLGACLLGCLLPLAESHAQQRTPDVRSAEQRIIDLTNAFRREQDLNEVQADRKLQTAAREFARFMARTDRHSHTADGRQPAERIEEQGYEFCLVSENIAFQFSTAGFRTEELARRLVEGWKDSPQHRENLLDPDLVHIGVGVARSEETGRYYAVQKFARPAAARIAFSVTNRSGETVEYRVDDRSFSLPPRMTRTHAQCRPPEVTIQGPAELEGTSFTPRDEGRYLIQPDRAGELKVWRE